ncbi:pyridoxal phosphate-dependent aminotransferase [Providencia stuartii]|uniref:pyridoxal phosphate-dependent aminotransferase n=1 Tax=Providencia TaxID=586 RepID=UPI0024B28132|nr:pyridoxal phosphate-dependent aminotransferase [Providencia sp. 2023EL-00965]ELR5300697.1 pyridoxal phosphate-dependent aminotransferase [Providencia stuartii]MDW7589680.1 pyridoxal phosphate-dependent aminotransferase [Providencia sp. 2023EL-00965]
MIKNSNSSVSIFEYMSYFAKKNNSLNLSQGIPDNIYDNLWDEAIKNSHLNMWQYQPSVGYLPLIQMLLKSTFLNAFDDAIITSGCTEALLCGLYAWSKNGYSDLIVMEPFYSYYIGLAKLAHLKFKPILMGRNTEKLIIDWMLLKQVANSKSIILINTPHNPSGAVFTANDWQQLWLIQDTTGCAILIDDVYRHFNFTEELTPYLDMSQRNILIAGSVSKSFAATGVRVGWLVGTSKLLEQALIIHKHMSNCQPELLQRASLRVMQVVSSSTLSCVSQLYHKRAIKLYEGLFHAGFNLIKPNGGHFIMASHPRLSDKPAIEQAIFLTLNLGITPLPLNDFFYNKDTNWLRFSFALNSSVIDSAYQRLMSSNF